MAANKFATMLHRNTNKITLILIYAVLEWTLITLLLLNSLFSYLIIKFADYFGLKPPCLWCSRIDHFFEPNRNKNSHRDLFCEFHSSEISRLGYCSNHQKLAESQDMCEDCLSSQSQGKVIENGEMNLKCSCCGVSLESKFYSPYCVIDPYWDVLEYTQKGNLIAETEDENHIEKSNYSDPIRSDLMTDQFHEAEEDYSVAVSKLGVKETKETVKEWIKEDYSNIIKDEPNSSEILSQHLDFFVDYSGNQLVPIELLDSISEENQICFKVAENHEYGDYQQANASSELLSVHEKTEDLLSIHQNTEESLSVNGITEELLSVHQNIEESPSVNEITEELLSVHQTTEDLLSVYDNTEESKFAVLDSMEMEKAENSLVFHAKESDFVHVEVAIAQATQTPSVDFDDIEENAAAEGQKSDSDIPSVHEEAFQIPITENEAEVSIGTDEIKGQDNFSLYAFIHEERCTSSPDLHADNDNGFEKAQEEETVELKTLSVQVSEHLNEIEEEKIPDTPTSLESLNHLHKKLLLLERKESGAEESLDGSMISELEGGDAVTTAERLKSALRAERKALHALYAELEEERSASAVAANQTMAMINRLQEEKAAMQMEALQYQRMMEEQSEYDQEALQLLNELMVKREKEKQELEKELEAYRKKVLDFEAKEKMRILRRSRDGSTKSGTCSASCSHSEDGDGMSIDLNQETKEEGSFDGHQESQNHNTPVDAVLNLEESLADFEEERMSILEQLKVLEERLFTLSDEEDQHFEDIRPIEHFYEENGKHSNENSDSDCQEVDGIANGFSKEMNGKHFQERRIMGPKANRLLPLFDAISTESEDGVSNGHENGFHSNKLENSAVSRFELEKKRIDIEEEVDQVYGRLQDLEADREFLKHCISSLKKGDKGTYLLQEILQHLRDLRNVELRARTFGDGTPV